MTELAVIIENSSGTRTPVNDAIIKGWSSHYGSEGGGFGYLRFDLPRRIGVSYDELGFGNSVTLYKSASKVLFDGMIRQVEESSNTDSGDMISVTALGWGIVAQDDEMIAHYCDGRLNMWKPSEGERPYQTYRPDQFTYGTNNTGLYIHANNNTAFAGGRSVLRYDFHQDSTGPYDEDATRVTTAFSMMVGRGTVFEGTVTEPVFTAQINTVDDGTDTVVYKNDIGEDTVANGDTLSNTTRNASVTISTVTQGTNTIVLSGSPDLSSWAANDQLELVEGKIEYSIALTWHDDALEIGHLVYNLDQGKQAEIAAIDKTNLIIEATERSAVTGWEVGDRMYTPGPLFWGEVDSIASAVITYKNDTGEGNLTTSWGVVNHTKKHCAEIQSYNTTSNTITVTDAEDIETWEEDDVLELYGSLFYCQINGTPSGTTITYDVQLGEWLVENDTGWVVWNQTQDDYATVWSWNTSSNQFDVDAAGDISGWVNNDELRIFAPFYFRIYAGSTQIWPTDWREGARMHTNLDIDVNDASPSGNEYIDLWMSNYISGTADESSFVQLKDLRVYNTATGISRRFLFQEMVSLLQNHGLSGSVWDISGLYIDTAALIPAVFEFVSPADALTWICQQGDGGDPPGHPMVWGVRLNADKRLYMEPKDLSTVKYIVRRISNYEFTHGSTVDGSAQIVQGVYTDVFGEQQFTGWYSDADAYWGGSFIRRRVRLENVDNATDAGVLVQLYLDESKYASRRAGYRVEDGSIFDAAGHPVPYDEVQAGGGLVKIEDWRAAVMVRDTGMGQTTDWTTDEILAVEVDYQNKSVQITPAGAKQSFEMYMAELARIAEARG
jgi:hypothetical protein